MKKLYICILSIISCLLLTSCEKITIVNEVINRVVNYGENVSILDFEDAIVEASSIAKKSVVGILTKSGVFQSESFGSGIIVKKEELKDSKYKYYVLTNKHVAAINAVRATVTIYLGDKDTYTAKVETYDDTLDLAIISFESLRVLDVAKISTENIEVGRFVIAVGNPYDLDKYYNSVTVGNISHLERYLEEKNENGELIYNKYIQHNAEINSGNSGGGLFNIKGELIGINTWKIVADDVEGMSFAIPTTEFYEKYKTYFE